MISSGYAQLFEGIHLEALKAKDVQNSSQVGPVDEKTPLTARRPLVHVEFAGNHPFSGYVLLILCCVQKVKVYLGMRTPT